MKIVEHLRKRSHVLTFIVAFIFGAIVVQFLWAFEFQASRQRGPGNLSLLATNYFSKSVENLNTVDSVEDAVISIANNKELLIASLREVYERHKKKEIDQLIQALNELSLPKSKFDIQQRTFVHEKNGERFTKDDATEIAKKIDSIKLKRYLLDAETSLISMEMNSQIGGGFSLSLPVRSMIPFEMVVDHLKETK